MPHFCGNCNCGYFKIVQPCSTDRMESHNLRTCIALKSVAGSKTRLARYNHRGLRTSRRIKFSNLAILSAKPSTNRPRCCCSRMHHCPPLRQATRSTHGGDLASASAALAWFASAVVAASCSIFPASSVSTAARSSGVAYENRPCCSGDRRQVILHVNVRVACPSVRVLQHCGACRSDQTDCLCILKTFHRDSKTCAHAPRSRP